MPVIPGEDLRDDLADVLHRVDAGEEFVVTVDGRPVARLAPARARQWVSGPELDKIWDTPAPEQPWKMWP